MLLKKARVLWVCGGGKINLIPEQGIFYGTVNAGAAGSHAMKSVTASSGPGAIHVLRVPKSIVTPEKGNWGISESMAPLKSFGPITTREEAKAQATLAQEYMDSIGAAGGWGEAVGPGNDVILAHGGPMNLVAPAHTSAPISNKKLPTGAAHVAESNAALAAAAGPSGRKPTNLLNVANQLDSRFSTGMPQEVADAFANGDVQRIFRTSENLPKASLAPGEIPTASMTARPYGDYSGSIYVQTKDGRTARWKDPDLSMGDDMGWNANRGKDVFSETATAGSLSLDRRASDVLGGQVHELGADFSHTGHNISDIFESSGERSFFAGTGTARGAVAQEPIEDFLTRNTVKDLNTAANIKSVKGLGDTVEKVVAETESAAVTIKTPPVSTGTRGAPLPSDVVVDAADSGGTAAARSAKTVADDLSTGILKVGKKLGSNPKGLIIAGTIAAAGLIGYRSH